MVRMGLGPDPELCLATRGLDPGVEFEPVHADCCTCS